MEGKTGLLFFMNRAITYDDCYFLINRAEKLVLLLTTGRSLDLEIWKRGWADFDRFYPTWN